MPDPTTPPSPELRQIVGAWSKGRMPWYRYPRLFWLAWRYARAIDSTVGEVLTDDWLIR